MNINRLKDVDNIHANGFSDDYLNFVGSIYKERLSLSTKQVDDFIKSSKEMKDRMSIIAVSKSIPSQSNNVFKGGVSLVSSKNADELLPLEKATGFRVPHEPGKEIVEISRVAIAKDTAGGTQTLAELLSYANKVVMGNKNVQTVYYYTSKAHHKLYNKFGFKGEIVHTNDIGEVVVAIDQAELIKSTMR